MKWEDDSILPYLGFNKSTYINKTKYEAENSINIGDNIFYLVIENISDNPMFLIDIDLKQITKIITNCFTPLTLVKGVNLYSK